MVGIGGEGRYQSDQKEGEVLPAASLLRYVPASLYISYKVFFVPVRLGRGPVD